MTTRLAWALALVALACAICDTAVTAAYQPLFSEQAIAYHGWPFAPAATVGAAVMGAMIVSRHAHHPIGWLLSGIGVVSAASLLAEAYSIWVLDHDGPGADGLGHAAGWISVMVGGQVALGLFAVVFLVAPNGRLLSRRWRPAVAVAALGIACCTAALLTLSPVGFVLTDNRFEGQPVSGGLFAAGVVLIAAAMVGAVASMIVRWRRAQGDERQQLRLISLAAGAIAVGLVWLIVAESLNGGEQNWVAAMPLFVAYDVLPICIAVAVLRFRLYDIDVIINRTVLVAVGAAFAATGYVALVVAVGAVVGSGAGGMSPSGVWPSLAAMVIVALAFQPLRRRVVRLADRIAYGARAAPYEALAEFSRRLAGSPAPESLLPAVAEATASAVSADLVTVRLSVPGDVDRSACWPRAGPAHSSGQEITEVGVVDRGEQLGSIGVVMPPGRALRAGDRALLADLADQAALAFRNNRLAAQLAGRVAMLDRQTAQLADSRSRIIAARDDERDRLEQAIRVGVVPYLEPSSARLRRVATRVRDPEAGRALAAVLADTVAALESLRGITRGILPRNLARSGLAAAVSTRLGQTGQAGALTVSEAVVGRRFDRTVESTAYFGLVEGLRRLGPPLRVTLDASDTRLTLTIEGSARAVPASDVLRDRLDSVGGSVRYRSRAGRSAQAISIPIEPVASSDG